MGAVLIVEDDALIARQLAEMLRDAGYEVAGPATNTSAAWPLVEARRDLICAILDVNIGDNLVFPIAQVLTQRAIPILFATASPAEKVRAQWPRHEVLQKPFDAADVLARVRALSRSALAA